METWTIEEWPLREQPVRLLAQLHEAGAALHEEATPADPRSPLAMEIAEARNMPGPEDGRVLAARDAAGALAGAAWCHWEDIPGWDHMLMTRVAVLPGRRRQGLGRLLLDRSATLARCRGLRLVTGRTRQNVPSGAAFCDHYGAERALVMEESRLDLRAVDRAQVDGWLAAAPGRAAGYRLEFVDGATPPELADRVAAVLEVMNTAPQENLDVGDVQVSAGLVAEYECATAAQGKRRWAYYTVHEATGEFAGFTDITITPAVPDRVHVGATAVAPAHRGHGLGKWLKSAMTARICEELPAARWVITWNAGSNDAMLAINRALGFAPAAVITTWQISTSLLTARLADEAQVPG